MQLINQTMKKYFITALNIILLFSCICCNAKNEKISPITKTNNTPPDSRAKILGIWYRDKDRSAYWEFKNDGKVYCYSEGVLENTSVFSISHSCGENSDPESEFLKLIDEDGSEYCSEINGINEDNSGILSLTSMQNLKVTLFVNNVNITIPN